MVQPSANLPGSCCIPHFPGTLLSTALPAPQTLHLQSQRTDTRTHKFSTAPRTVTAHLPSSVTSVILGPPLLQAEGLPIHLDLGQLPPGAHPLPIQVAAFKPTSDPVDFEVFDKYKHWGKPVYS